MQVAFQPAPFGVPGLHDPGPGGPDLLQLGLHLGLQPGMLQRHARRRRGQPDQLRLELQPLVVDQHGLVRACYRHHRPPRIRPGHLDRLARGVQVAGPVRQPERQLERRVTQRPGQRVPEPGRRGSRFQVDDRGAERTARRPGPYRADHEQGRAGQQHQREQAREGTSSGQVERPADVSDHGLHADREADPHQRHHGPPGPAARRPPVQDDQDQHDAGHDEPDVRFDRVERIPGRPGTVADEQQVGRAAGVTAAERRDSRTASRPRLKATICAYSAMTTPHSNLERSRPVGQARPRWARAAPLEDLAQVPDRERDRIGQVDQDVRAPGRGSRRC